MAKRGVHAFSNGVQVYKRHLRDFQLRRYAQRNVHEADEEDVFVQAVKALPPDGVFVAIGAAIGYYPILAKRLVPGLVVHAYEPLAVHRRYFRDNLRLNGIPPGAVVIHPEAVSSGEGAASFFVNSYGSRIAGVSDRTRRPIGELAKAVVKVALTWLGRRDYRLTRVTRTKTVALETVVGRIGRNVSLVQVDIQGHEVEVLRTAGPLLAAGRIETFLIGTHGTERHRECIELLESTGYAIELDEPETQHQPDGIVLASKGVSRLTPVDADERT